MYTLRFANSALRRNFPTYERQHADLDSVALEILRIQDELEPDSGLTAYPPQVEDSKGQDVTHQVPTASHRLEVRESSRRKEGQPDWSDTREITGHQVIEITEIDGRYVSGEFIHSK